MLLIVLLSPFFYVSAGKQLTIENATDDKLNNDSINVSIHTSGNVNIYIVPGTVTINLVENPSVKITHVNDVKKKRKGKVKKKYIHHEEEKIAKINSSGKESENTIVRIVPGSKSPNSYLGLNDSQDVIVPVSVNRIKMIEFNLGYSFIGYYFQFLEDKTWGYMAIKILKSINDASHVRPPPFQIFPG